ncbi:hypothetical protein SPRG_13495 [Saprolegnia parasitica CBS 223.65]|uniref:Uncharacterized protein n=1 Tax=Saprolegnia parasitica (strain CBS 223.65) TaxID=695850 RepID=A0A067BU37_SAPPC|nr:hypothetical protein SPRG_13495 [Saprolegnia parasitica CBS 223.65]KDO20350.1 hypothetical protein SPRG_13495 [Saprolegnia parasitica CBS 223.65]|eukprot:XP_012208945.1 hypothetical protein SPRG_13495 [Saprolegnia parasitica CBS 223.65]
MPNAAALSANQLMTQYAFQGGSSIGHLFNANYTVFNFQQFPQNSLARQANSNPIVCDYWTVA